MIRISDLLKDIARLDPDQDAQVTAITEDSRRVIPGALFLACPGLRVDGRNFIAQAIAAQAGAVLYEKDAVDFADAQNQKSVPVIGVPQLSRWVGVIASRFYREPTQHMTVVGVTGTNGKTSITQFIAQALAMHQRRAAVIGTLGKGFLPHLCPTGYTTPSAVSLQKDLAALRDQNADAVAMEVSSHSLDQHRVAGVKFDLAIFTNLTRDHLDYHKTMDAYGAAKAKLFQFPSLKYAIYNGDNPFGLTLLKRNASTVQPFVYTTQPNLHSPCPLIIAERVEPTSNGFKIHVKTPWGDGAFQTVLLGRFNVSNVLAVLSALGALGFSLEENLTTLSKLQPVPGRMQSFGGVDKKPRVIVDYAHTPDALYQVLSSLREHRPEKLWCVFGCGGDRDRGKRPQMGEIAETYSDRIVLTNDNPRTESPEQILRDIQAGLKHPAQAYCEPDRAKAIAYAIQSAAPEDIILIAGKGHETEQIIGTHHEHFSDTETVESLLQKT